MPTIVNRSKIEVSVPRRPHLTRLFSYRNEGAIARYIEDLKAEGYRPTVRQLENCFQVLLRKVAKGAKRSDSRTCASREEAEELVAEYEAQERRGGYRDDSASRRDTFVDLLRRYIKEEGPNHEKSWKVSESFRFARLLRYATGAYSPRDRRSLEKSLGKAAVALHDRVLPAYQWMTTPLVALVPADIERYLRHRQTDMGRSAATVDREMDDISLVLSVARNTWGYNIEESLTKRVRRPKYNNEVVRRISVEEMKRIILAAYEEDQQRCRKENLRQVVDQALQAREGEGQTRYYMNNLRKELLPLAEDLPVVPLFTAFVCFQLLSACRRGESLSLQWKDVHASSGYAYLPETKNGHPRDVPLVPVLVKILEALPHTAPRVFPFSKAYVENAWKRVLRLAGIESLRIHDMRHEAISWLAENTDFSDALLMTVSGHRDPRMLRRYTHPAARRVAQRMADQMEQHAHPLSR
ncbi:MAG: site-specific integrase [Castellaniella sp.]|uniref:tyrosine-type recombinase/integrase n=1 Tax=Castellaniella sp. TaxID=1955812 RepID=UPI003C7559EA